MQTDMAQIRHIQGGSKTALDCQASLHRTVRRCNPVCRSIASSFHRHERSPPERRTAQRSCDLVFPSFLHEEPHVDEMRAQGSRRSCKQLTGISRTAHEHHGKAIRVPIPRPKDKAADSTADSNFRSLLEEPPSTNDIRNGDVWHAGEAAIGQDLHRVR